MLLQRIALERFGQLDRETYTFQPGLNLIKGPNEAGKTTLQEAILFALLGNPRHATLQRAKNVEDCTTWGQSKAFKIALDFEDEDGTSYQLEKDWAAKSARLSNLQTDEQDEEIDSVQRRIGEVLGCDTLNLLQSTVCVEQDAIDDVSAGRREIGDQLQSIVTGGGADEAAVSAVLADLAEKIAEMERGWRTNAPKNPGPIKVKQDQIARLDERLAEVRPQVGRAEEARERLVALEAQIDEAAEELAYRQALKASCDRRFALEQELETWAERENKLEASIERIERLKQQVGSGKAAQSAEGRGKSRLPIVPLIGFGVGTLLILIGLVIGIIRSPVVGLLLGLPGTLIGAGCFFWLVVTLTRARPIDPQSNARARLDALLEERALEDWIAERKEASKRRRDAEETLEEPEMQKSAEVKPREYEKLKQEIERLEEELEAKRQEQTRQETRRDDAVYTVEEVHQLEERKAAGERELERLKERLIVYKLTHEVMEEAKRQTMSSARDELEPRIADHLSYITQGRYDDVKADDDLNLRVFSSEKGGWIAAESEELSRGTLDQLYLAARLALLELLYRDARPPLLLDDPFVKFDPSRREQALELCKEVAKTHQVLLFTCHDHYDSAADWTVELPPCRS